MIDLPSSITRTTPLIVAVSGGADSMSLLHLLRSLGFRKIRVAHLNHQIRKDSGKDAPLVKKLARQMGFPVSSTTLNIPKLKMRSKDNQEAIARDLRYGFLRSLKKKYRAKYIVTAHHGNDQAETVLMNLIRGCGLEGLRGMKTLDGDLWRPLLSVNKKNLLAYCRKNKISFREDSTNADTAYRRNYLRLKIIPQLLKLNPRFLENLNRSTQIWNAAAAALEGSAKDFIQRHRSLRHRYDLPAFIQLPEAEQQAVLRRLFEMMHGSKKNLYSSHLNQLLRILNTPVSGKRKEFGPGKSIVRRKEFFEITKRP